MDDRTTANDGRGTESGSSRRRFMAASALVGAGAFGLGGPVGSVAADEHGEEGANEDGNGAGGEFEDDVNILNYARTLEFLEADFYRQALGNMSERDLVCTDPVREFGDPVRDRVYGDLQTIQEHEETHAEVLGATIEELGGEPIDEPEFEFGAAVEEPTEFLATAAVLEDTGVGAYAGAAPSIRNAELIPPALSIHSVEARHASFLRVLGGDVGFPDAFDEALDRATVEEAAGQFIVD